MLGIDLGNWSCHVMFDDALLFLIKLKYPEEYWSRRVNTYISQIKCLLGRKFSDPELQLELDYVPFRVIEGPDGCPLVHGRCKEEDRAFTPVEILAMLISSSEFEPHKYLPFSPTPCIGIPIYFTDQQKKDVLQAAKIAGLPGSLCLLDETTAMVVAQERLLGGEGIVAFVDIGHASMQICFAEFKRDCSTGNFYEWETSVNILYKGYARSLGGREFDKVFFKHFASKIRKEYNIDVSENSSACVCLSEACESLKNDLSKSNEASFYLKKFSGLIDVKGSITRNDFQRLSYSILKKIEVVLKKALHESRLDVEKIKLIQLVGKGCSIPAIIDIFTNIFGEKLTNASHHELVASGCTMEASQQNVTGTGKMIDDLNMHRIGRSEKTEMESYRLSKANYNFDEIERAALRRELSEAQKLTEQLIFERDIARKLSQAGQKLIEQLMSERDDARKLSEAAQKLTQQLISEKDDARELSEAAHKLTEQLMCERDDARKLSVAAQKHMEQLMSERDDARKQVEELRRLIEQQPPCSPCVRSFAEYSYSDLQDATNNFHESFKLGEGGFGIVYKGILHNTTIAIKMLKEGSKQGAKEFNQEIKILSEVRHSNLVALIGACAESRALIYEYLPNGSLEDHLRCKNNTLPLSWQARVRIAFEICTALSFLHCVEPHGIVHGDLKPDNILLDENNTSKICDFGLCRQLNWTASASIPYHLTDCLQGTFAYMDPEYFSTGKTTPQYDVYSFGILLLRLATCKSPIGIRQLVEAAQKNGTLRALIDASAGRWPFKEAKKMISLGLTCSDPMRKNRPDLLTEVLNEMKSMLQVANARSLSWAASLFNR